MSEHSFIELSIGSLSVKLDRFLNEALPRVDAEEAAAVTYTASGNVVERGTSYAPFALWAIEAHLSRDKAQTLNLIYLESELRRRLKQNRNITVVDRTLPVLSKTAPSRAVAPGTTVTTIGEYRSFYAVFNAVILKRPALRISGKGYAVEFTLQETEATVYVP